MLRERPDKDIICPALLFLVLFFYNSVCSERVRPHMGSHRGGVVGRCRTVVCEEGKGTVVGM